MEMQIHEDRLDRTFAGDSDIVIAVVTATKPDFYKQAPLIPAADDQDVPAFVLNTGQHYDDTLGHGLEEYDLQQRIGADLNIRGGLSEKTAQTMTRVKAFADHLDSEYDTTVVPVVHGDTLAAGIVPQAWMFATNQRVAHNEAGLRGMAPCYDHHSMPSTFIEEQRSGDWEIDRTEPFPEQYDTFVGSAAAEFLLAPTELNQQHLLREGYQQDQIGVVGNSVVDAIEMKSTHTGDSVFDIYPTLEQHDDWIRVDIHRRANLREDRFRAIIECVIRLVEDGHPVNLVELNATRQALEAYGLKQRMERLAEEHDHFLYTGLWKKHAHVYEFLRSGRCLAELTDSGSMQEELNHIEETICLTARFNTDRPETVFEAGTNLLVPPISGDQMHELVTHIIEDEQLVNEMQSGEKLYGSDVGDQVIEFIAEQAQDGAFEWSDQRHGFGQDTGSGFEYL